MNITRIHALYFSPTGGTEGVVRLVTQTIAQQLGLTPQFTNITSPEKRQQDYRFDGDELVVIATPVYAGRVPNKLLPDLKGRLIGNGAPVVAVSVFGNRSPDEAPRELALLLEGNGFRLAGVAAFAGRHAFSDQVGEGRPDEEDLAQMSDFAARAAEKLAGEELPLLNISREEIGPYYTPLKADGTPAKFLKARPLTDWSKCSRCGACARACPMGSIDMQTMEAAGLCVKCQACVRKCTRHAKYFEDPDFLSHVAMLEQNYTRRAENRITL